jgi:hypothetical protein
VRLGLEAERGPEAVAHLQGVGGVLVVEVSVVPEAVQRAGVVTHRRDEIGRPRRKVHQGPKGLGGGAAGGGIQQAEGLGR